MPREWQAAAETTPGSLHTRLPNAGPPDPAETVALHAIFELLGPATGGFTTITAVENGIPGLVLIYTIHRFCFNKRIPNAVLTAPAVKLVVTLCYIFPGLGALNLIYG